MSELKIYSESGGMNPLRHYTVYSQIRDALHDIGVRFERWETRAEKLLPGVDEEVVLDLYRDQMEKLMAEEGYKAFDAISVGPDHPDKEALRKQFLREHTHPDEEVRFFVEGRGLFTLHHNNLVYDVLCEAGDVLIIPPGARHWFDMGNNPEVITIRLFNNPDGWVAHYTGSPIADHFSRFVN
ncbi:cupin domain-containing protein [Sansalvadorimonas sp. 2012CJ34-2]|uniref:Acireductone dioxygenase n=1 Tax=Parendozoicomonas callyspongiae TaxID=2942213 RepID=A0ABT0PDX5_9GAMM|nr:cupin domain-containing protein [Sansalvadorimonas sp. 2012CJ34-2]MCL6269584.1 cupin domain-containing protein [Sansalvadorimonas sp. 2012CJ34-2]